MPRYASCLATLCFRDLVASLQLCETEQIILPMIEKAENLGSGVWLITSATTAYTLFESDSESTMSSRFVKNPGCRIFILRHFVKKMKAKSSSQMGLFRRFSTRYLPIAFTPYRSLCSRY